MSFRVSLSHVEVAEFRSEWYVRPMQEIQISKFKATCRAILDRVAKTRKPVLVTRFGKPVARIFPPPSPGGEWLGAMKDPDHIHGTLADRGDLSDFRERTRRIAATTSNPVQTDSVILLREDRER